MTFDNKTIKLIPGIEEQLHNKIMRFHLDLGQMPGAILLGPLEYISLMEALGKHLKYVAPTEIMLLDKQITFMGMEVLIKQSGGVDVVVPSELVSRFVIGRLL